MSFTPPYNRQNYFGECVDDTAALAVIRANHCDSSRDGLGNPFEGQWYVNTSVHRARFYDGTSWQYFGDLDGSGSGSVVDYTASAVLTATDIGKTHICTHATVPIQLTLPAGAIAYLNKKTYIVKRGVAAVNFRAVSGNVIALGASNGALQNTTTDTYAVAWVMWVGSNMWIFGHDYGEWEAV